MLIKWIDERCILCTQTKFLTNEHVIPAQIGGILSSDIICKDCNDYLGHSIEANIKNDPSLRLAIEGVKNQVPDLYNIMIQRLPFLAKSIHGTVKGSFKNEEFNPFAYMEQDKSIIQPTKDGKKQIKKELKKQGKSQEEINLVLDKIDNAPLDERIELDSTMDIIKWGVNEIQPDLTGDNIDDLFLLKIVYEFLSLHIGSVIYDKKFGEIRDVLLGKIDKTDDYEVEYLRTTKYEPFHGIFVEQNHPITIQIRLFGWLVYRIVFPKHALPIELKKIVYHLDLKTNIEDVSVLP